MTSFSSIKRQKCEEMSIEHLPNEIIHAIFCLLDKNSIKNCAVVNKRFADIVAGSSVLLGNFKLKLDTAVWQSKWKIHEILSLERRLQMIEITDVEGNHEVLVKILKVFGPSLRSLTIADSKIDDFTLREILRSSEVLENLVLSEVSVIKKLPAINPVSMRSLKSLTINHCDWNIIKFIKAQLKSFEVKSYLNEGLKTNLVDFLTNQYKLKDLKLRGTSARLLFQQDDVNVKCNFSLENFLLEHEFGKNSDNVNWNLTSFLSLHIDSLKRVEITGPHCEHINGFVIANLDNLHSLIIDVRGLPKNEEFYEVLEMDQNTKLRELSFRGFFVQPELIKKILKKYPAIEKLELNDWGNGSAISDMLVFISKHFPKLKSLSITEMTNNENAKFAVLNKLTVAYIRHSGKLLQFIRQNSSVDTFKVGIVYIGEITSFVDDLKQINSLKHLAFGGNRKSLNLIVEMMKKYPKEGLETLELSLTACEDKTVVSTARKTLKLYFPIDKTLNFEFI